MENLLTRANMNQFLTDYMGLDPDQVGLMQDYVKKDLIQDQYDEFEDYIKGELHG